MIYGSPGIRNYYNVFTTMMVNSSGRDSELLYSYGVKPRLTTVKNPQSNRLHERMHLVLREMLRTQQLYIPHESTTVREINRILQCTAWA